MILPPESNNHFLPHRRGPNVQAGRMTQSNLIPTPDNTDLPATLRHDADARSLRPLNQAEAETTYLNGWDMTCTTP